MCGSEQGYDVIQEVRVEEELGRAKKLDRMWAGLQMRQGVGGATESERKWAVP